MLKQIKNSEEVVLQTDKTGKLISVQVEQFVSLARSKILEKFDEIDREGLVERWKILREELTLLEGKISTRELDFVEEKLKLKKLPQASFTVKDHKKPNLETNFYPIRLIQPANSFASGFNQLGYEIIKSIFNRYGVSFSFQIRDSYDLLSKLKRLNFEEDDAFLSLDVSDLYPSITYDMIEESCHYFTLKGDLSQQDKGKIKDLPLLGHS